jgi:hypothetical protein
MYAAPTAGQRLRHRLGHALVVVDDQHATAGLRFARQKKNAWQIVSCGILVSKLALSDG